MTLIDRQAPSHWYLRDGRPFHQIAKKDGSGDRAVTLADARKVLALPSVTNILGVLAKPGLDAWRIEQGIMAALTLPRGADEPLDAFARRVVKDMSEQVEKAADFGAAIHAACEAYAINKELPSDPTLLAFIKDVVRWFDENVERIDCIEQVMVHPTALYAGRVDMVAKIKDVGWCVVDFKTQKVKRSAKGAPKPAFYETWPLQLAAYREAVNVSTGKNIVGLVSVVIDSVEPGPVHVKVWPETFDYTKVFAAAYNAWKYVKCYSPGESALNIERPELN
ncbi:MAG: hypothetical protein JWO95_1531 [Verrucomicrobiales bacterium]|nr:hypothetical protein [Verrucomicrobiales bacterium]